jgi:hypothetical protein
MTSTERRAGARILNVLGWLGVYAMLGVIIVNSPRLDPANVDTFWPVLAIVLGPTLGAAVAYRSGRSRIWSVGLWLREALVMIGMFAGLLIVSATLGRGPEAAGDPLMPVPVLAVIVFGLAVTMAIVLSRALEVGPFAPKPNAT